MLASSASTRPRYVYSRPLLASLTVSVASSLPQSPPRIPALMESSSRESKKLILPLCESSRGSDRILSAFSSSPPAPSSSPRSSSSTSSVSSISEVPLKASATRSPNYPSLASPTISNERQTEAELRVRFMKWLNSGRLVPLDLHCSRDVYISTARLLEIENLLPRMARDFDPTTDTWHLRSRPHILHEIGHPVIGEMRALLQPQLSQSVLGRLSNKIVWHRGSDTTPLPNGGVKEPDAGIGLEHRALPTIVIEVGYSESRAKLRLDAHRWLQTGLPDRSMVKRKRGDTDEEDTSNINPRPVMLVMLISFEGKRPSIVDKEFNYSESDFADGDVDGRILPKALKPLTVWVELWRLSPVEAVRPMTRSNTGRAPTMADRKRFWPSPDPNEPDFIELFATDIFGGDKVRDPGNTTRFKIPLVLFQNVLRVQMSLMKAQEAGEPVSDSDDDVIDLGDGGAVEDAENFVGDGVDDHGVDDYDNNQLDTGEMREGGNAVLVLRNTGVVVNAVSPAEKRQKL